MTEKTYLEKLVAETIRPILGALQLLEREMAETLSIPDSPWKVLNKPYDQLTEQEILVLMDIYHTDGESKPCPMCDWMTRMELQRVRKEKEQFGG